MDAITNRIVRTSLYVTIFIMLSQGVSTLDACNLCYSDYGCLPCGVCGFAIDSTKASTANTGSSCGQLYVQLAVYISLANDEAGEEADLKLHCSYKADTQSTCDGDMTEKEMVICLEEVSSVGDVKTYKPITGSGSDNAPDISSDTRVTVNAGVLEKITGNGLTLTKSGNDYTLTGSGGVTIKTYTADPTTHYITSITQNGVNTTYTFSTVQGKTHRPLTITSTLSATTTRVQYFHYTDNGNEGLRRKRVTTKTFNTDGTARYETVIYGYYAENDADANKAGKLKFIVNADGVVKYLTSGNLANGINESDPSETCGLDTLGTVGDDDLMDYASEIRESYDSEGRIVQVSSYGGCGGCGGGGDSAIYHYLDAPEGETNWDHARLTQPLDKNGDPVGERTVEFYDDKDRLIAKISMAMDYSGTPAIESTKSDHIWVTHYVLNDDGQLSEHRYPSACTGYVNTSDNYDPNTNTDGHMDSFDSGDVSDDAMYGDWVRNFTVKNDGEDGLVRLYGYYDDAAEPTGDGHHQLKWEKVREGTDSTNDAYWVRKLEYGTDSSSGKTTYDGQTVYRLHKEYRYQKQYTGDTPDSDANGDPAITTYTYAYYQDQSTDTHAVEVKTVTYPTVATGQNGPNTAATVKYHYKQDTNNDLYYNDWTENTDGSYSYTELATSGSSFGKVSKSIRDADTDHADVSGFPAGWTGKTTGALHLKTTYTYDDYGRTETVSYPDDRKTQTAHTCLYQSVDDSGTTRTTTTHTVTLSTPHIDGDDDYDLAPMSISVSDLAGRSIWSAQGVSSDAEDGNLADDWTADEDHILDAFNGTLVTLSHNTYYDDGKLKYADRYHDIPSSGDGSLDTNFYRTIQQYDDQGRQEYTIQIASGSSTASSVEQITQNVYDGRDRVVEVKRGVSNAGHNMTADYDTYPTLNTVSKTVYDDGSVGDGRVTKSSSYHGTGTNDFTGANYHYTFRGHSRGVEPFYMNGSTETAIGPYTVNDTDWLGRTVASATFDTNLTWSSVIGDNDYAETITTNRRSLSTTAYDDRGRAYQTHTYEIDSSDGSKGNAIITNNYYDLSGRLVATETSGGGAREMAYDAVGRQYQSRTVTSLESTKWSSGEFVYRDPQPEPVFDDFNDNAGNDNVLSLSHTEYTDDSSDIGRPTKQYFIEANHDDTDGLSMSANDHIIHYTYTWFDAIGRQTDTAAYGTGASTYSRNTTAPNYGASAPARSDTILVTTYTYNSAGHMEKVTDPAAIDTKTFYDDLGRTLYIAENWDNFDPDTANTTGDSTDHDKDRVTQRQYNALGQTIALTALDTNGDGSTTSGDDQSTYYIFGGELASDTTDPSLLRATVYPDAIDDASITDRADAISDINGGSFSDYVALTYNLDGSLDTRTDQRGVTFQHNYTNRRQLESQVVTTDLSSSDVDDSVLAIKREYDDLARLEKVTSYDGQTSGAPSGNVVNQVQYAYNDFGQLANEYQDHDSVVSTSGTVSPNVAYAYDTTDASSEFTKAHRLKEITYPNGRKVHYVYDGHNGVDDAISRVNELAEDNSGSPGTAIVNYDLLGSGRMVQKDYPTPDVRSSYHMNDSDGDYEGFDRFGRLAYHRWWDTDGSDLIFHTDHTYDRVSNRLTKNFSGKSAWNETYTYDDLHRLKSAARPGTGSDIEEIQKIIASDGASTDEFGHSVAVSGDVAIVGAPDDNETYTDQGTAYIFRFIGSQWVEEQELTASDAAANDWFGKSVAISGDVAIVGAYQDNDDEDESGSAYIFRFNGSSWVQEQKLTASDPEKEAWFGNSVAISGDVAIVGANGDDTKTGAAYIFRFNGSTWTQEQKITATDGAQEDWFGCSVGISGDVAIIGAYGDSSDAGSAYIIRYDGSDWDDQTKINPSDAASGDLFGWSVSVSGDLALVGAYKNDDDGTNSGSAYIFRYNGSWSQEEKLTASDGGGGDYYGYSVSISGDVAVVGARDDEPDGSNSGSAYISRYDGTDWDAQQKIYASDAGGGDRFGNAVAISDDRLIVGAFNDEPSGTNSGSAYLFGDSRGGSLNRSWTLDQLGNWPEADLNRIPQNRDHSDANEITEIDSLDDNLDHDAAGNMTRIPIFDGPNQIGNRILVYDAWNRLTMVQTDDSTPRTIATYEYDGLNRRIVRDIDNSADPDASLACEYHDYYNGWSLIEMRNENNRVLKQMVWGTQYIDELVQVGVNPDPTAADEQHCDAFYYALTGSNFSIMGITDASGELVERYAYTPYGQRQVFVPVDAADTLCLKLAGLSTRVEIEGAPDTYHPYGLCEFGHQGLMHDEATPGLVQNRNRIWLTDTGRFAQRDPIGYLDGMNAYAGYHILHGGVDPTGERLWPSWFDQLIPSPSPPGWEEAMYPSGGMKFVEYWSWTEVSRVTEYTQQPLRLRNQDYNYEYPECNKKTWRTIKSRFVVTNIVQNKRVIGKPSWGLTPTRYIYDSWTGDTYFCQARCKCNAEDKYYWGEEECEPSMRQDFKMIIITEAYMKHIVVLPRGVEHL